MSITLFVEKIQNFLLSLKSNEQRRFHDGGEDTRGVTKNRKIDKPIQINKQSIKLIFYSIIINVGLIFGFLIS